MTDPEPVSVRIAGWVFLLLVAVGWLIVGALVWLLARCWQAVFP